MQQQGVSDFIFYFQCFDRIEMTATNPYKNQIDNIWKFLDSSGTGRGGNLRQLSKTLEEAEQ